jgi:hypothetical protein
MTGKTDELKRLIEIQGTLLRRALISADHLRWQMLDAGLPIDRPPECVNPRTGAKPPGAELVTLTREEQEMKEELVHVPAVRDMQPGDFQRHLELRHSDVTDEEGHSAEHYADGAQLDHVHKPDAWQKAQAARADIRFRHPSIDPIESETLFLGEDNA